MKYRLKDERLKNFLENTFGSENVERTIDKGEVVDGILTFSTTFDDKCWVEADIHVEEIEEVPEYDPDNWNDFPQVTPPEGVWMRCERDNSKFCAEYVFDEEDRSYKWFDDENYEQTVDRFRPWED